MSAETAASEVGTWRETKPGYPPYPPPPPPRVLGLFHPLRLRQPSNTPAKVGGYYNINGIWALKPHYLGPWTLRAIFISDLSPKPATSLNPKPQGMVEDPGLDEGFSYPKLQKQDPAAFIWVPYAYHEVPIQGIGGYQNPLSTSCRCALLYKTSFILVHLILHSNPEPSSLKSLTSLDSKLLIQGGMPREFHV